MDNPSLGFHEGTCHPSSGAKKEHKDEESSSAGGTVRIPSSVQFSSCEKGIHEADEFACSEH